MGLNRQPINKFDGGLNLLDGPIALDTNEAQSCENVQVSERGILKRRSGLVQLDTSGFPASKRAENLRPWYTGGGSKLLMCSIDGTVYSMATNGVLTSRNAGTAGTVWSFESGAVAGTEYIWFMNGTDTPKKMTTGGTVSTWTNAPNGTMCVMWQNRMIVAGVTGYPQRISFSDIADFENPASSYGIAASDGNWVDIRTTEDDLDPITCLHVVGDVLLVFKRRSVWAIYDSNTFVSQRLGRPGCLGRFQSAEIGGRVYFLSSDGVYSCDQESAPMIESRLLTPLFIDGMNQGVLAENTRLVSSVDRKLYLAYTSSGDTENDYLLEGIPDMVRERTDGRREFPWLLHNIPVSSLTTYRVGNDDEIVAGSSATNKLYRVFQGSDDDGVRIDAHWFGQWRPLISEEPFERLRRINVEHAGRVVVDVFQDFNTDSAVYSSELFAPAAVDPLWDGGVWDGGTWNTAAPVKLSRIRPEKRARYHAVRFRVPPTTESAFIIYAAELVWRGGKEH